MLIVICCYTLVLIGQKIELLKVKTSQFMIVFSVNGDMINFKID